MSTNLHADNHDSHNSPAAASSSTEHIEFYSTPWCRFCQQARAYMQDNNIAFIEYDIESSPEANARHKELTADSNMPAIPLFVINGKLLYGFQIDRFEAARLSATAE